MNKLSYQIGQALGDLDANSAKIFRACLIQRRFADAVRREYGDERAAFVLSHVQGVYLRRDEAPRTNPDAAPAPLILRVYSDDSLVRSDLDGRQESLKLKLLPEGIRFDRLQVIASRFDMRKREPFRELLAEMGASADATDEYVPPTTMTEAEIEETLRSIDDPQLQEVVRRAMRASAGLH